ncbi:MAG TPA: LamG-like jellyroll fold domain-containing protein, partial [Solirubrobacteraceae bacterium]|nr:LamG-like jellyroll fold domain-containing protein [Solirubrobacteraceae bacterium]
ELNAPAALPVGQWSHLAVTSDGQTARIFVDGQPVATGPSTTLMETAGPLRIGGNGVWTEEDFRGRIDEVRVYDRALTADQIGQDRQTPITPQPDDGGAPTPVAAFGFDVDQGATITSTDRATTASAAGTEWNDDGKHLGALWFDGRSSELRLPRSLSLGDSWTFEAWVRSDEGATNDWRPLISSARDDGETGPALFASSGEEGGAASGWTAWTARSGVTGTAGVTAAWTHLALTYGEGRLTLYRNGQLEATDTIPAAEAAANEIVIGSAGTARLRGSVDDVRLYDRAIPSTQVVADMQTPVTTDAPEAGLSLSVSGAAYDGRRKINAPAATLNSALLDDCWCADLLRLTVSVDDEPVEAVEVVCANRADQDAPCEAQADTTFDARYRDGHYAVAVRGDTGQGSEAVERHFSVAIDRRPPASPLDLVAEEDPDGVRLAWSAPSDRDVVDYEIHRVTDGSPVDVTLAGGVLDTEFVDETVDPGQQYTYSVAARDAGGRLSPRTTVPFTTARPAAPADFSASAHHGDVHLGWTAVDGATYEIFAATDNGEFEQIATLLVGTTAYVDNDPPAFSRLRYYVRAVRAGVRSRPSTVAEATVTDAVAGGTRVRVEGGLAEQRNQPMATGSRSVLATADFPAPQGAGLQSVDVLVDGHVVATQARTCAAACSVVASTTIDAGVLSDGTHSLSVAARRGQTEVAALSFDFEVDQAPPTSVTGLTIALDGGIPTLAWASPADEDISGYDVARAASPSSDFVTLKSVATGRFADHSAPVGELRYRVRAVDEAGTPGPWSSASEVRVVGTPLTPVGLGASSQLAAVKLVWNTGQDRPGERYVVYRSSSGSGNFRLVTPEPTHRTTWTDDDVSVGVRYHYVVEAVGTRGERSSRTPPVSAVPDSINLQPTPLQQTPAPTRFAYARFDGASVSLQVADSSGAAVETLCSLPRTANSWYDECGAPQALLADGETVLVIKNSESIALVGPGGQSRTVCGGNNPSCSLTPGSTVSSASATGDAGRIYYAASDGVYSVSAEGTDRRRVLKRDAGLSLSNPQITADGKTLYGIANAGMIFKARPDGSDFSILAPGPRASWVQPSPDGTRLAFGDNDIPFGPVTAYTSNAQGNDLRSISQPIDLGWAQSGGWSRDSSTILIHHYWYQLDGSQVVRSATRWVDYGSLQSTTFWTGSYDPSYSVPTGSGRYNAAVQAAPVPRLAFRDVSDDRVIGGASNRSINVEASEPNEGVAALASALTGAPTTTRGSCTGGCPAKVQQDIDVPFAQLPEGTHRLRVAAVGAVANGPTATGALGVVVDRSAPSRPEGVEVEAIDTALYVRWRTGFDPRLPDGTRSAGVAAYELRYKVVDGSWSEWKHTTRTVVSSEIPDGAVLETVQVRAIDRAGNVSAASGPDDAFSADVRMIGEARAAAGIRSHITCDRGDVNDEPGFDGREVNGRPEPAVAVNASSQVACRPTNKSNRNHKKAFREWTVHFRVCIAYEAAPNKWDSLGCGKATKKRQMRKPLDADASLFCAPGKRRYRIRAVVRFSHPAFGLGPQDVKDYPALSNAFACNGGGAWGVNAERATPYAGARPPGATLGNAMLKSPVGEPLPGTGNGGGGREGWEAHHMVPAGEGYPTSIPGEPGSRTARRVLINAAQARAWACWGQPNAGENGVWLRGWSLYDGTDGWRLLDGEERDRPQHQQIDTMRYLREVLRRVAKHGTESGRCKTSPFAFLAELHKMRYEIREGAFPS